jgi:ribosome-binding factor A
MSNQFKRTDRIAETMLRNLAQIIQQEITDPRMRGLVTISAVKVSKDLSHAKVYFTVLNDEPEHAATILNTAASYLRTLLAKTMKLRIIPQLHFVYDESIEYGKHLSRLIDEVNTPNDDDTSEDS